MKRLFIMIMMSAMGLMAGCQDREPSASGISADVVRPAKIVPVVSTGLDFVRTYPGILEAAEKAELAFRVSGEVSQLPALAGLQVKKGQLLAKLDDADFRNSLDEREARYQLAKVQHDQSRKLLKEKLTSQLQFDQSEAELRSARAALDQARSNLGYTNLYAPFDGVVAKVDIQNFQSAQAMVPVMTVQNDRELDIQFSVPESIISQLQRIEDPEVIARVCSEVFLASQKDRAFKACYKESESVADPITRNYLITFTLQDTGELVLLPGMTASIRIDFAPYLANRDQQRQFVPLEAVFQDQGKQWVWVVDDQGRAGRRQVTGGRFEGDLLEITTGLQADENVIAAGVSFVREGMLVRPISKERGL